MSDQVKISWNAAALRVRCEFNRAACLKSETPPADLIARAKAKLESVKTSGEIAFYSVYQTRLNECWKLLRNAADEPEDRIVSLTLGAGSPALGGIKLEKSPNDKAIAMLSIEATKDIVAAWRYEWFKVSIIKRLRDMGIRDHVNNAQVYGAFLKARNGEKVQALGIGATAAAGGPPQQAAKAFSVIANKQRMEIGVVIRNVKEIRKKEPREAMLALINQAIKQLSGDGTQYSIQKKDFLSALQAALDGPEGLGLELPLVLLAATGTAKAASAHQIPANYPGAGRINFDVSKDRMEATIAGFNKAYYDDPSFQVSPDWVQLELKRCLIPTAITDEVLKNLIEAIKKHEDLNGVLACRGVPGVGGKAPYLHQSYKDAAGRSSGSDLDSGSLDIREMQQRMTVKSGQLVAEIRYGTPPLMGKNIYGEDVAGPANDDLIIRVGDGIQQRDNGRFFATADGIPLVEAEAISLTKVLVHNGDVNLRTGNIRFDGPVEIKGSVDNGAIVETTGDLIVHGTIRGAQVICQGTLTVKSGITTGNTGKVTSRGDLQAEFIENSNITCGGNLVVQKALLNSQVIVGGTIRVAGKGGVIAGGRIISKDSLYTSNLGFKRGAITTLNVGVDWRAARAADIRKARLEKLQKRQTDDRQALRELVQKSKAQMTQRHKEMKEELQERLTRMRGIAEKAEAHLAKANASLTYSSTSRIYISELLAANMAVTICGQSVAVSNEVFNVAILGKRRRGSYIVPLEEVEAEEKEKGAPGAGDKKAG